MGQNNTDMLEIRRAQMGDWQDATGLAWKTFLKYEAAQYGEEGTKNFRDFLAAPELERMFALGEYPVFIAVWLGRVVGVISLRNQNHISLLFVDEDFHEEGIGSRLIGRAEQYVREEYRLDRMTVNAAPYAVGFYHRVGFTDTDLQQTVEGIIFTPMEKRVR